jgi:hypothetical protein
MLTSWAGPKVGGYVINKHAGLRGHAKLVGRQQVDSRVGLADSHVAGDDDRIELLVKLVARVGVEWGSSPRVADDARPYAGGPSLSYRVGHQGIGS